jgi:glycosyltransferase involved in cell wall biosynthesis
MGSSLPVLVSDRGGNPEVVRGLGDHVRLDPGDAGAWADAILRFARLSPEARLRAGEEARAIVARRFSPARYMTAIDEVYREPAKRS